MSEFLKPPKEATHVSFRHPEKGNLIVYDHPEADVLHRHDYPATPVILHWAQKHAWWLEDGGYIPTYFKRVITMEQL